MIQNYVVKHKDQLNYQLILQHQQNEGNKQQNKLISKPFLKRNIQFKRRYQDFYISNQLQQYIGDNLYYNDVTFWYKYETEDIFMYKNRFKKRKINPKNIIRNYNIYGIKLDHSRNNISNRRSNRGSIKSLSYINMYAN